MSLQDIATIIAILATLSTGTYVAYKDFKKIQLKYRNRLQKEWTNEGDISGIGIESHYCDLQIETDIEDGEITGVIDCRNIETDEEFNNISINGELNFKSAIITLSDVRRGKHIIFGKAKIKFKGKLIEWKLLEGNQEDFPKSTIFWKSNSGTII